MSTATLSQREVVELAGIAQRVAEEAATLVASGHRSRPHADKKGLRDLVTDYDKASEELLMTRLAALAPGIPVVGEEQTAETHAPEVARGGLVWYVDPLDGTTNFVHGHPFWCVAVGLMCEEQPVVGAIVAPILDMRWSGWVPLQREGDLDPTAGAAWRNGQRCRVSETSALADGLIATGFPPIRNAVPSNNFNSFVAVKLEAQGVRRCGSAAIDLSMVADGTYDGYWERRLHAWDIVAAGAVLLAAGGRITSLDGAQPDYHVGNIVATNGLIHDELLRAIKG
ncbi:MAG: inositol monophosphatase [Polyangiaceae bacterium]|nr:inositol monophosphatase [Polyangiaceae bacterium]